MSAATASSAEVATVFVRLPDEGVDVWRPVQAHPVSAGTYRLADTPAPADEVWSLSPGADGRSGAARPWRRPHPRRRGASDRP